MHRLGLCRSPCGGTNEEGMQITLGINDAMFGRSNKSYIFQSALFCQGVLFVLIAPPACRLNVYYAGFALLLC